MTSQDGNSGTDDANKRQGTISSAQAGNLFVAPLLLVATSLLAQQSILFLVKAGVYSTEANGENGDGRRNKISDKKGTSSYEGTASRAFGPAARTFSMALVCTCCFAAIVGYAVLLRDMLEPIVDAVVKPPEGMGGGPTTARNAAMLVVVICVTPLTTWKNLTALQNVGAASMASVLTVGICVAYRSIECQLGSQGNEESASADNLRALPLSMKQLLDSLPLFISSYICHFNVLPIHNELRCPTADRVKSWVRTSLWPATIFYYAIGFTGSMFAKCTPSGSVQGNILLDFDEDDPLLFIGRLCLASTITLAFPMLVIPARDILVRALMGSRCGRRLRKPSALQNFFRGDTTGIPSDIAVPNNDLTTVEFEPMEIAPVRDLEEPLLLLENRSMASAMQDALEEESDEFLENTPRPQSIGVERDSKAARTFVALLVFWSGACVACSVQSIDVVWDLVGKNNVK
ncbi:hypothetical protein ACHAXT_008047 [Thalassiosira profunda]